jgi:hypothetical protein
VPMVGHKRGGKVMMESDEFMVPGLLVRLDL